MVAYDTERPLILLKKGFLNIKQ